MKDNKEQVEKEFTNMYDHKLDSYLKFKERCTMRGITNKLEIIELFRVITSLK